MDAHSSQLLLKSSPVSNLGSFALWYSFPCQLAQQTKKNSKKKKKKILEWNDQYLFPYIYKNYLKNLKYNTMHYFYYYFFNGFLQKHYRLF